MDKCLLSRVVMPEAKDKDYRDLMSQRQALLVVQ